MFQMSSIPNDQQVDVPVQYHADRAQQSSNSQSLSSEQSSLRSRSCLTCRQRKVKCDKLSPCTGCIKSQFDCVYPPTKTPRGRVKAVANQRLRDRLEKLENLVHDLQGDPVTTDKTTQHETAESGNEKTESTSLPDLGKLVIKQGQCRYVENSFWVSLTSEVEGIRDLLEEDESNEREEDYLHSSNPFAMDLSSFHPPPDQISFLWKTFEGSVDPIIRILHKPSIRTQLASIENGVEMTRNFEAVVFAIYFAAVTSMTEDECQASLETDRTSLLKRYRSAIQQAFVRADLLSVHNIVILQALVIFLICELNHDDTRLVWTSTAVAIRIAQSLGIHRDGWKLGLHFFESEIRRRIWWQIYILDIRTAELHGSDPRVAHQALDTAIPLNINDDDLDPESTIMPPVIDGVTDLTMSLVRYEIINGTGKKKRSELSDITLCNAEVDRIIQECSDKLQAGYLRHCDLSVPYQWFIVTFARMLVAKMRINIHHRLHLVGGVKVLPAACKDRIFMAALEVVELCLVLEREESTRQWRWTLNNYIPWQAMVFLLSQVCQREKTELVDRAWMTVQDAFLVWGKAAAHKDVLWANMNKLMAKAQASRDMRDSEALSAKSLSPGLGAVNEVGVNEPTAQSETFDMTSNIAPESWAGLDPFFEETQQWWYDDLDNMDNWVKGDWSGFN